MEVPGMEGQETKNTAFVNAPETLVTLMSDAVMARWRHVEMPIEAIIRRTLLANDRDLYFLQKRRGKRVSLCTRPGKGVSYGAIRTPLRPCNAPAVTPGGPKGT